MRSVSAVAVMPAGGLGGGGDGGASAARRLGGGVEGGDEGGATYDGRRGTCRVGRHCLWQWDGRRRQRRMR